MTLPRQEVLLRPRQTSDMPRLPELQSAASINNPQLPASSASRKHTASMCIDGLLGVWEPPTNSDGEVFYSYLFFKKYTENTCDSIPLCVMWVSPHCIERELNKRQETQGSKITICEMSGRKKRSFTAKLFLSFLLLKRLFLPLCFTGCRSRCSAAEKRAV